jgi:hypothetical protein
MITSINKPNTRANQQALAAFVQKKAEIDAALTRLQALSDDHFGHEVTWGHVTLLDDYAELLKRITERALKEGEYAI